MAPWRRRRGRARASQPPMQLAQAGAGLAAINEAMAMSQHPPLGNHSCARPSPDKCPLIKLSSTAPSALADITTLQEARTVKKHDLRVAGFEKNVADGFGSVLKNLAGISHKFDSSSPSPRD